MIISHKYKFIFFRTEKTASSSLTSALENVIAEGDERAHMRRPSWAKYSPIHHGALKRNLPRVFGLHTHATAAQIRSVIGPAIFNSYLKFCVERNPWDRQVSLYFQRKDKLGKSDEADFDRDMNSLLFRSTEYVRLNNWSIYTINNEIVADTVIPYENLDEGLESLRRQIGLPAALQLPQLRSGHRNDDGGYRSHYTERTRNMVARWYQKEIAAFGYKF